jgi:hypothetical protein
VVSASHPFWSRDGRVLYYLATFPNGHWPRLEERGNRLRRLPGPGVMGLTAEYRDGIEPREEQHRVRGAHEPERRAGVPGCSMRLPRCFML